eukprot:RCo047083
MASTSSQESAACQEPASSAPAPEELPPQFVKSKSKYARLDADPNIIVRETRIVDNAACAARDFAIGETVFKEQPLIVIPKDPVPGHEEVFAELARIASSRGLAESYIYSIFHYNLVDEITRNRVQECFCPELGSDNVEMKYYVAMCEDVVKMPQYSKFTIEELVRYLLILRTNQHASGEQLNCSALYELGSKVTHSCDPNCMCIMGGVTIEYRAIRPIRRLDMLTFSYISAFDLWKSTPERRTLIRPQRFFDCCCSRCVGPDFTRRMRCPACGDHRTLYFQPGQPSFVPTEGTPTDTPWTCFNAMCGRKFSDAEMPLALEERLSLAVIQTYFQPKPGQVVDRAVAKQMLDYVEQEMGHYHWLTALMTYTQLALSHSAMVHKHTQPDPPGLMLLHCEHLLYWFSVCMPATMEEANMLHFIGDIARMLGDTAMSARAFARALPLLRAHWTPLHPEIYELEKHVMAYGEDSAVLEAQIPYERQLQIVEYYKSIAASQPASEETSVEPASSAEPNPEVQPESPKAEEGEKAEPVPKPQPQKPADSPPKSQPKPKAEPKKKAEPKAKAQPAEKAEAGEKATPRKKAEEGEKASPRKKVESKPKPAENGEPTEKPAPGKKPEQPKTKPAGLPNGKGEAGKDAAGTSSPGKTALKPKAAAVTSADAKQGKK